MRTQTRSPDEDRPDPEREQDQGQTKDRDKPQNGNGPHVPTLILLSYWRTKPSANSQELAKPKPKPKPKSSLPPAKNFRMARKSFARPGWHFPAPSTELRSSDGRLPIRKSAQRAAKTLLVEKSRRVFPHTCCRPFLWLSFTVPPRIPPPLSVFPTHFPFPSIDGGAEVNGCPEFMCQQRLLDYGNCLAGLVGVLSLPILKVSRI